MTGPAARRSDFFVFGAGSEVMRTLVREQANWFHSHVRRFVLVQRSRDIGKE